jgi:predicted NAD/FAD-binding protein
VRARATGSIQWQRQGYLDSLFHEDAIKAGMQLHEEGATAHADAIKAGMQLHKEGMQSIAFSLVVSSLILGFAMYTSAMHISK